MSPQKSDATKTALPGLAQDDGALVYALHDPKDLPTWCRALLDPDRPLPADVLYIARSYLSNIVVLGFMAIPALFAVLMTAIDGYHGKLIFKEWLVLFPLFTLPAVWVLHRHRRDTRLGASVAAGRLRMGLFLTRSALLLRMSPQDCSMVPRRWISGFDLILLNAGRAASPSTYGVRMTYRIDNNGQTREKTLDFACPELQGYFQRHDDLLALLRRWLADGSFAKQEHPVAQPPRSPGMAKKNGSAVAEKPSALGRTGKTMRLRNPAGRSPRTNSWQASTRT